MPAPGENTRPPMDLVRLRALAADSRDTFTAAAPFPHVVIDNFLDPAVAAAMAAEFDPASAAWVFLHHVNERKLILNDVDRMGPTCQSVVAALHSDASAGTLPPLTGLPGLLPDP